MSESQSEIDLRYYSRWEIAEAREYTARSVAFIASVLAAIAADLKWDWWVWNIAAFIVAYLVCTFEYSKETKKAWENYEGRPILKIYAED